MKTKILAFTLGWMAGILVTASAQPVDFPPGENQVIVIPPEALPILAEEFSGSNQTPPESNGTALQQGGQPAGVQTPQPERPISQGATRPPRSRTRTEGAQNSQTVDANTRAPATSEPAEVPTNSQPAKVVAEGEKGLRLNFRNAPLELVLDYLSEAAGFIIRPEVDVKGKVDVWSNQPLTKDEAVELLNSVLNKNGYAALRDGRTLSIVTREEAKRRYIPVKTGSDPAAIPKTDEIVTQVIPVRFINAVQLTKDLQPLLPSQATMTANEGGNALVITDTQMNIRRMAEIIRALDTSIASVSAVRVFPLRFADAKALADVIKEVFQTQPASATDARARFFARFRGPFGGPGGDTGSSESSSGGRPGASRVAAVADERSNSLVVSAPEDLMPTIEELVKAVDVNVEDVTEVRVFRLKNADPQEMADLLSNLFPNQTTAQNQGGRSARFFNFGGPGQGGGTTGEQSERMRKQGQVVAVADPRTSSVVVSAARELMNQIASMIQDLDSDPGRQQKVFVFDIPNADPQTVQNTLQNLFADPSSRSGTANTRSSSQIGNQLSTRASQQQNQSTTRSSTTGVGGTGTRSGF